MIGRLWALMLGAFALGLDAYVLAGLLPAMARDLHTTQAMVGLGVALFTAAYAVAAPTLAFVAGRYSTGRALLAGLTLFTAGNVMTMLAPSLSILFAARVLAGIGAGLYSPLAAATAAGLVTENERGRALALVLAGLSIGTAFGVPLGLLVEDRFGWRWTIGLIVMAGLVAAAGVMFGERLPPTTTVLWRERIAALRSPFTLSTLGVTSLTGIASLGLYTYLAEIAVSRGLNDIRQTLIWAWGLGGMIGALLIGRIIDRYASPARALYGLLAVLAASFMLVAYGSSYAVVAGCFLWGLAGWASVAPQQHALVSHGPTHATASIAWNSSVNYMGGAIGAVLGSTALNLGLTAAWLPIGAAVFVVAAIVVQSMKPR